MRALLPVTAGLWCALAVVGATDTFMESRGLGDPNVEDPNTVDAPIIVDKSFSRHKIILYVVCGMLALIFSYLCSAVAIIRHTEGVWRLPVGVSGCCRSSSFPGPVDVCIGLLRSCADQLGTACRRCCERRHRGGYAQVETDTGSKLKARRIVAPRTTTVAANVDPEMTVAYQAYTLPALRTSV